MRPPLLLSISFLYFFGLTHLLRIQPLSSRFVVIFTSVEFGSAIVSYTAF